MTAHKGEDVMPAIRRLGPALALIGASLLCTRPAAADPAAFTFTPDVAEPLAFDPDRAFYQATTTSYERHMALGIATGKELGIAAALLRFRLSYVGFEAAFGIYPILIMTEGACNEIIANVGLHFTGSLLFFFDNGSRRFSNGLRLAGIWDDKYGPGASLGWQAELHLKQWLTLAFGVGIQVFWDGEDWAKDEIRERCGTGDIQLNPAMTYVQPYIGVALLFYLF